ncbi:MAG: hypothetical protein GF329_19775 [Candidatus Lokiarchaeota archaeon]|nr:hypothetical protein [Candidatus Lokiarchaeota archaeon]
MINYPDKEQETMIQGIYIFTDKGKKFAFKKELRNFDEDTQDSINKTIMGIVNRFDSYDKGVYRTKVLTFKVLFSISGEIISILFLTEEEPIEDEELTTDTIEAMDSLFASIIFNQPLLTRLLKEQTGKEDFLFYVKELPQEKQKELKKKPRFEDSIEGKEYVKRLDSIVDEVNVTLGKELQQKQKLEKEPFIIQKVFSNFIELTFRYVRMYLMENLVRDLIEDHPGDITNIKLGINDFLFYFRKAIKVLKNRPEIKYFLRIMDGKRIGVKIKERTAFTTLFLEEAIEITNGISENNPLIYFNSIDLVIDLIMGKLDILNLALSQRVKVTQLDKFVEIAAPLAAVLIKIYKKEKIPKTLTIKRLMLEGLSHLIEAIFVANIKKDPNKRSLVKEMNKIIYLTILNVGIITIIVRGNKKNIRDIINVKVGPIHRDSDIVLQGELKHICLYANGEINFITALTKIKLTKGISMNPLDLLKGKTFKQIQDLFSLWRLTQI